MKFAERLRMALAAALLAGTTCAAPAFADEGEETPGMVTMTFVSDGDVKESREVSVDGMVGTPPSISKDGYSLDGWFDSANHKVSANTPVAELASHAVTAKWSVITYTITYRNGSATLSLQPSAFNINSGVLTLPMSLSKDGWDFVGWYDNPNPTGTPVTKFSSTSIGDKTFYAKWSVIDYSITYKDGTKTIPDLEPHCYNIESGTVILPSDVQKSGYIFDGWFTNPDFEGDPVTTVTVTDCEDKTYYAKFEEDIHWVTLTFVSMGKEVDTKEVSEDGLVGELPNVSEPGYDLIGWFDKSGQQIFDDTLVADLSSYTIEAEWSAPITYRITYKDGTDVIQGLHPDTYNVTDETVVLPTDVPKSGYNFKGWYDNIKLEGDQIEQFDATDCEDKIFYAKYEAIVYDIVLNANDGTYVKGYSPPTSYTVESDEVILPTASDIRKAGHRFVGWYESSSFAGSPVTVVYPYECEDKTYYAKFEDIHKVTLTFKSMGKVVETRDVSDDGMVGPPPSVSEQGYTLDGWFDDSGQAVFNDTLVAELSSLTIYAEWSIITYKIMYRDGTNVIPGLQPSSYKVIDKTVVLPTDVPKSGYAFKGWYEDPSLAGSPVERVDVNDCEDKVYYAKYELDAYPLWIGGVQFTAGNLVIDDDDDPGIASGTATYDPASNTLWLTNFVYSGAGLPTNGIYSALYYKHSSDFVIDVCGTNRLAQYGADEVGNSSYSIGLFFEEVDGQGATVTIRSANGGRLSVAAGAAGGSYGIATEYADLVIDGAAVSAVGGPGLYDSYGAYFVGGRLTIESGSLAAQGGKATNYDSVGVKFSSADESLFVKGGSLTATGGEAGRASYGIQGHPSSVTPLSFTGGETLAQGGTAGIANASLSVADGLAVFAGADADGAALVTGDGWKDQKCVRIAAAAPPPVVSNVVARQRWPWNGLVDVDYEVGGDTTGMVARISFAAPDGRTWNAPTFLDGAEPSAAPGFHRVTWDTKADGVTNVVTSGVVATVELVQPE